MPPAILSVSALLSGTAFLFLGSGLYGTLLAIRAAGEGFSPFVVGAVMGAYYLGFLFSCLWCPKIIHSVGHIRTYTALTAIASAATLAHVLEVDPVVWGVLRVIVGFCFAGLYMTIESWLNEKANNESRGRIFAIYMMVNLGAVSLGQLLLLTTDSKDFALFAVTAMLISLAAVPIALANVSPPTFGVPQPVKIGVLWQISPLALVACAGVGIAQGSFWSLTPVFTLDAGLSENGTALFMALAVFGGLVLQWPIGWISDRWDRRSLIFVICALTAIVAAGATFAGERQWAVALYALGVAYGGLSYTVYSLAVSHAHDHAEPGGIVSLTAQLLLVYAVGALAGPLIAGWLIGVMSPGALFGFIAVVFLLLSAFGIWRQTQRPPVLPDEQTPFVPMSRAGALSGELDPRQDDDFS
ncbi:MAG: MFS family permease [Paracoccaceae bacterium]|jgi:MFS family permease